MFSGTPWRALIVLIGIVTQLATSVPTRAQGLPQIVWMTNAHVSALDSTVSSVAVSRNGILATAGRDHKVNLWRIGDGQLLFALTNHTAPVLAAAFSSDGALLATSSSSEDPAPIRLWRVADGQQLRTIAGGSSAIAFSPDGTLLAAQRGGEFGWIDFYSVSDGSFLRQTDVGPRSFGSIAFSPNGPLLAAKGFHRAAVWMYNVSDASEARVILAEGRMLAYSPDGMFLALPGSGRLSDNPLLEGGLIRMVDPQTGVFDRPFLGDRSPIPFVAFSGDGKRLVSASQAPYPETRGNGIRVWRVANRKAIAVYDLGTARITSLAASPNNRFFAYRTQDGTVVVARMPIHISKVTLQGDRTVVEWEGTGGPYQLQQCTNSSTDVWHNVGEVTSANSATNSTTASGFYRVQDLGNQ